MTEVDTIAGAPRLPKRAWIRSEAIFPVVGVAIVVAVCAAVAVTSSMDFALQASITLVVIVVGIALGLLLRSRSGPEVVQRRAAVARSAWARQRGWSVVPDGDADASEVALGLPAGWRVVGARGRLDCRIRRTEARVETWVLHPALGSRRRPTRREIVSVGCEAAGKRFTVSNVPTIDPLTVSPAWSRGKPSATGEPSWANAVRELVQAHKDLPLSLTIGDGRVVILALDDPRPETAAARIDLAIAAAQLVN